MKVRWTRPALVDLSHCLEYLDERNPVAASTVARAIQVSTRRLIENPNSGRPGRVDGTRELVILKYPYVVAYRVTKDSVDILAVRHSARLWPQQF